MAHPKVYVDGFLLHWVDTLFFPSYRPVKSRPPSGFGSGLMLWRLLSIPSTRSTGAAKARAQIERTARKVPEVMVKITNKKGAGRGMKNIRNHIDYISRNGQLEIEDQDANRVLGKKDINELKTQWQLSGGRTIPEDGGRNRDALNVIFSMNPGTPPDKVKDAVREFLQDEFAGREYVFVLHTDTLHPHVHVCVKTAKTPTLKRLSPNRNDLQCWREGFAEKLRDNGIEANATARRTRGETRYPVKQLDIHRAKRFHQPRPTRQEIDLSKTPQFAKRERGAWKAITNTLGESEQPSDVLLAKNVRSFWQQTPYATYAKKSINEKETHVRKHNERSWFLAATRVHQPNPQQTQTRIQPKVQPVSGVWPLPGFGLASQQGKSDALLLYPDAPHYVGWATTADSGMRRPDIRSPETSGGVKGITVSAAVTSAIPTPSPINPVIPNAKGKHL